MNVVEVQCLSRIEEGTIRLTDENEVEYFHARRKRWYKKSAYLNKEKRKRYSFRISGKQVRGVYRNRLVWLIANSQPIPNDCFIDHINGITTDDRPENLQLMKMSESHSQGRNRSEENTLNTLLRWFEFVGTHGREPITPEEKTWVSVGF